MRSLLLVASFSYCLTSYGAEAHAAGAGRVLKADEVSHALKSGRIEFVFHNVKSPDSCIGVADGKVKNRAYVKQGECRANDLDQVWVVAPIQGPGEDYVELQNAKNRKLCLAVEHGSQGRADIMLGVCRGQPDQKWTLPFVGVGPRASAAFIIKNAHKLCVGVEGGSTARAQLKQNTCRPVLDQAWFAQAFFI